MKKKDIPGTRGYAGVVQQFIDATCAIDFKQLHKDFVPFFPQTAGRILDIGAGIGRDAATFAQMGHTVVAIEPIPAFRAAGRQLYDSAGIEWIDDALPGLEMLNDPATGFDFILVSGVWHHLDLQEQFQAMQRIAALLNPKGIFALTLRNGPAGAGTHIFPTDGNQTIRNAAHCGLHTRLFFANQPSLMNNKEQVSWTKLAFQKPTLSA